MGVKNRCRYIALQEWENVVFGPKYRPSLFSMVLESKRERNYKEQKEKLKI